MEYVYGPNENHYSHAELFVNDGIYQNFLNALVEGYIPTPVPLDPNGRPYGFPEREDESYSYTIGDRPVAAQTKLNPTAVHVVECKQGIFFVFQRWEVGSPFGHALFEDTRG